MSEAAQRLLKAWRGEIEARHVYDALARREKDPRRSEILRRIADAEAVHRRRLEERMRELGVEVPDPSSVRISPWLRLQARLAPIERLLRAREAAEDDEVLGVYGKPTGDDATDDLLRSIRADERSHSLAVAELTATPTAGEVAEVESATDSRLQRILGRERWHRTGGSWISDAIYGANDGLAAVFGIVAGVSGATGGSSFVLTAGLAGAISSALSMGVGAWLAARSQTEIAVANLEQERRELQEHPAEEQEELSLFYQLKGLSKQDADELVEKLARNPEAMLKTLAAEELGSVEPGGNPWTSALAGFVSTAVGAMVPVTPFFFVSGTAGVVWAAAVSLVAHFVVGAVKSLFTLRSWWSSGLEMTAAGVLVGGATYALGLVFKVSGA
ncbi:VIT1/CCC1 transporter family protein [Candidatus Nephthysia bennettiae]|uniref:VIT1/CCC1 transporter family protein n=1 Tax=Candidatus Nephthysia bennettiae TaxID=3127016 RepID=A0A934NA60_9BACT|nr:VIT1/CCC1 transporter family protein [Candidatus Dormibacteraeota bacterium]MBJ7612654.1 VIT1/CCC1 transporter family protein [Candidatus Dormibacteraeota bacterium]